VQEDKKKLPWTKLDTETQYIRRIETILVHDGTYFYSGTPLVDPAWLARIFSQIRNQAREEGIVLFMDHDYYPIGYDRWLGGIDFVTIDVRRILALASNLLASAMAVLHNHPQGSGKPSSGDEAFCLQLLQVCSVMGWGLMDFIIMPANGPYYSFREHEHPAITGIFPKV
jgi:DNA repair protein RadC